MIVGADVNKRVLHALADTLADDSGYAFTGVDVRLGWGGVVTVTIFGETDDGVPGSPGRALRQAVESALDGERHAVRLETSRRS
jgi:hypothetical protein